MNEVAEAIDDARRCMDDGRFDEAIEILVRTNQSHSGDEDLKGEIAHAYAERGYARLTSSRVTEAKSDFEESITWHLTTVALIGLAEICEEQKDVERARELYGEALSLDPEFAPAREGIASLLLLDGRVEEAEAEFRKVAEDSGSPTSFLGLAKVLEMQGKEEACLEAINIGLQMDPKSEDLMFAKALRSDPDTASRILTRLLEMNHTHFDAWFERARVSCTMNDPEEAATCLDRCLKLDAEKTKDRWTKETVDPRSPLFPFVDHPYLAGQISSDPATE